MPSSCSMECSIQKTCTTKSNSFSFAACVVKPESQIVRARNRHFFFGPHGEFPSANSIHGRIKYQIMWARALKYAEAKAVLVWLVFAIAVIWIGPSLSLPELIVIGLVWVAG